MKLILKQKFPGLNDYTKANRGNKYSGNELKQTYTDYVIWECKSQKIKPIDGKAKINFTWHEQNGKRDPDNICFAKKFILDGLVKAGALKNDTQKYIKGFTDEFKRSDGYMVEVELEG